jgi:hypothetical protein
MCYHGSPPPGIHLERSISQALYYGAVTCHVAHFYNLRSYPLNRIPDPYEANYITPGSSACDLTIRMESLTTFLAHQLTE